MNKQLKLLNIYSSNIRETEPFTFNEVLQLRDGIKIIKNQNRFLSSKMQLILKKHNQYIDIINKNQNIVDVQHDKKYDTTLIPNDKSTGASEYSMAPC